MSTKSASVLLALSILLYGCNKTTTSYGLSGTWIGSYRCPQGAEFIEEIVDVSQNKDFYLKATKVTGDPCVPAGNITFEGRITLPIRCTIGSPSDPANRSFHSAIKIESASKFSVCNVNYVRK